MAIEDIYAMLDAMEDVDTAELRSGIENEFDIVSSGAAAKVDELIAKNAQLESELKDVKARNYELMTAATSNVNQPEDEEEEPEVLSVDNLFKEV